MTTLKFHSAEWPFVRLLAPFAGGISCAFLCPEIPIWIPGILLVITLSGLLAACFGFARRNLWRQKKLLVCAVLLFLFAAGLCAVSLRSVILRAGHFSRIKGEKLIVLISQEPVITETSIRFAARVTHVLEAGKLAPAEGNLQVFIQTDSSDHPIYRYGDELILPAKFQQVPGPLNPAEFNYKKYLHYQQTDHQIFLRQNETTLLAHEKGNPVIAFALRLRQKMVAKLARHIHDHEALSVASTLLLGYRATLSDETLSAYSRTGTLHVLSVSGMHVALLYWLIAKMLSAIGSKSTARIARMTLSIALIWAYALLTGFSPSVNRAALMLSLILLGKTFSRNNSSLNILAFSALVLLIYNPFYLADVGFQLSYLAVAGLIIIQPALANLFESRYRTVNILWQACAVSVSAQLATTPLSLFYFHQFPLYFLLSNLVIILPSTLIMYCGMVFLLFPGDGLVIQCLGWILEKTIVLTNTILSRIEHWPFAAIDRVWIDRPGLVLLSATCLMFGCLLVSRNKRLLLPMLLLLLFFSVDMCLEQIRESRKDQLAILSLRKHHAFIFKSDNQAYIFSDLNENDKPFRYSVRPLLDSLGVRKQFLNAHCRFASSGNNLVQMGNKLILIYDRKIHRQKKHKPVTVDAVFVTGNPYASLIDIRRKASFKLLVLGNNNTLNLTKRLSGEAAEAKVPVYVLRDHRALFLATK